MLGNCPKCGRDYLDARTIENGDVYAWTRAKCPCGHIFLFRFYPPGTLEIAQNETTTQKRRE
jgi:hypothetical protein